MRDGGFGSGEAITSSAASLQSELRYFLIGLEYCVVMASLLWFSALELAALLAQNRKVRVESKTCLFTRISEPPEAHKRGLQNLDAGKSARYDSGSAFRTKMLIVWRYLLLSGRIPPQPTILHGVESCLLRAWHVPTRCSNLASDSENDGGIQGGMDSEHQVRVAVGQASQGDLCERGNHPGKS